MVEQLPQPGQGYETIPAFASDEPPPPPADPLNPGAGIPLRDDGVDLDELSGSSTSLAENNKKDKRGPKQHRLKEHVKNEHEKKEPKKKEPKKAAANKAPIKSSASQPRHRLLKKGLNVSGFFKFGRIIGPIVSVAGATGVATLLVIFFFQ